VKRTIIRIIGVALLAAALVVPFAPAATAAAAAPGYNFTTIDYPGSVVTAIWGINAGDDMVGVYVVPNELPHGFVLSEGVWTTIDAKANAGTTVIGVGPSGVIVGDYQIAGEAAWQWHSFLMSKQGDALDPVFPGHASSVPMRVLPDGTVVGWVQDTDSVSTKYGAVRNPDGAVTVYADPPNSQLNGGTPNGNVLVGAVGPHGYMLVDGVRVPDIDYPAPNVVATSISDINPAGRVIVGYYVIAGFAHGFIGERDGADGWAFRTVDYPYAIRTVIRGMNAGGTLVGQYQESSGKWHAFLATPVDP